ncbi:MAG: phosphate-starvation-inducible PsiE family protein [Snowella sp.]|nr:phosphate-starvation-inducible PsiE family protein [Snowella sp.]
MWEKSKTQLIKLASLLGDDGFLALLHFCEKLIAKILSACLVIVIFVSLIDLMKYLYTDLFRQQPIGFFGTTLIEIFGLFLNILIAMELLENITGYLKKNVIQVELVIVTSIIAVARKIIIFDFNKYGEMQLAALVAATVGLSGSYWLLKQVSDRRQQNHD